MSTMTKRLDALERIAAEAKRRQMRDWLLAELPEARRLPPAMIEAATDEALRYLETLRLSRRRET